MEAQPAAEVAVQVVHEIWLRTLGANAANIRGSIVRRAGIGTLAPGPAFAPTTAALAQEVVILWLETGRHARAAVMARQPRVGPGQREEGAVLLALPLQTPGVAPRRGRERNATRQVRPDVPERLGLRVVLADDEYVPPQASELPLPWAI